MASSLCRKRALISTHLCIKVPVFMLLHVLQTLPPDCICICICILDLLWHQSLQIQQQTHQILPVKQIPHSTELRLFPVYVSQCDATLFPRFRCKAFTLYLQQDLLHLFWWTERMTNHSPLKAKSRWCLGLGWIERLPSVRYRKLCWYILGNLLINFSPWIWSQ